MSNKEILKRKTLKNIPKAIITAITSVTIFSTIYILLLNIIEFLFWEDPLSGLIYFDDGLFINLILPALISGIIVWKYLDVERFGDYNSFAKGAISGILTFALITVYIAVKGIYLAEEFTIELILFYMLFSAAIFAVFYILAGIIFSIVYGITAEIIERKL